VFPLRGKLLNVRSVETKVSKNEELQNLKNILGLQFGKQYKDAKEREELRYGKVMLMTDQDHDGSHIKGLFINFVHKYWPALLKSGDFLEEFVTPIIKATMGKESKSFFTIAEYGILNGLIVSQYCNFL
jgi:DNA topoisomerase II